MAEQHNMTTRSKSAAAQATTPTTPGMRGRGRGLRQTPPAPVGAPLQRPVSPVDLARQPRARWPGDVVAHSDRSGRISPAGSTTSTQHDDQLRDVCARLDSVDGAWRDAANSQERWMKEQLRERDEEHQHAREMQDRWYHDQLDRQDRKINELAAAMADRIVAVEDRICQQVGDRLQVVVASNSQKLVELGEQMRVYQDTMMAMHDSAVHQRAEDNVSKQRTLDWVSDQHSLKKKSSHEVLPAVTTVEYQSPTSACFGQAVTAAPGGSSVSRRSSLVVVEKRMDSVESKVMQVLDMMKQIRDTKTKEEPTTATTAKAPCTTILVTTPVTPASAVEQVAASSTVEKPATSVVADGVVSQVAVSSATVKTVTPAVTEGVVYQNNEVFSTTNSAPTVTTTPSSSMKTTSKPRRLESNVPKYKGDTNLAVYLAQFEVIAELADWPREIWGRQLLAALDGRALQILAVETWSATRTYEEVTAKLKANFGQEISSAVYLHELGLLQRRDQETLYNLCMRVKDIAAKALPGLDGKQRSQFCMQHFINALGNPQQQSAIWAARVTTLEDALEVAVACENGARMTRGDSTRGEKRANPQVRHVTADWDEESYETSDSYTRKALGEIATKLCGLETTVRQLKLGDSKSNGKWKQANGSGAATVAAGQQKPTSSDASPTTSTRAPYCYNCKVAGHWLKECTQPRHNRCYNCDREGHRAHDCPQARNPVGTPAGLAPQAGLEAGRGAEGRVPGPASQQ